MKQKWKEWLSMQVAKRPRRTILGGIIFFNIVLVVVSAFVISSFSMSGTDEMHFFEAAFCTLTMILDPGCIQFVVADIGKAGVAISVICLLTVITGMITFTGAVIGYTTNSISEFIQHSDKGTRKLEISDHVVILNWNTRASEMVNDLLYCKTKQKVVVLAKKGKREIEKEIMERLSDTIARENAALKEKCSEMPFFEKISYEKKNWFKNDVTVIVREGDVFSSRQLKDICLEKARTVIILGNEVSSSNCYYEQKEKKEDQSKGNSQTIKTLMQVADITAADYSNDNQKIIVEITDDWTSEVVDKIIKYKQVEGKCNIVPLHINQVLGQILSQFSLMPELNLAYEELFSNRGATFYSCDTECEDEEGFVKDYLKEHLHAIPLTIMEKNGKKHAYYVSKSEKHVQKTSRPVESDYKVKLNYDYWLEQKNIIILGHNSHCKEIMEGFCSFRNEWNYKNEKEILRVVIIDDEENLKKMNYYRDYPFVINTVVANVYDKDIICSKVEEFVDEHEEDTSILILSDDTASSEETDANALANLVYIQDIIRKRKEENPDFDENKMDVIVEIIDPKHHDIINSYSINNVVISNRYISKMITQIGEKEDLFEFYNDILMYDSEDADSYVSKEIYIKKVRRLFTEVPGPCTAAQFIRKLYEASTDLSLPIEKRNPTIPLGYIKADGKMVLFSGNQIMSKVELTKDDKLIVFSNH